MDATIWVKLRDATHLSWHVLVHEAWTRCGLLPDVDAPRAVDLPLGERSCERCLQLRMRDQEKGA